ncbi:MAG: CheY-like chemotaxis protein [Pseudohongiellaceae bacterium]|jgi:CheY-like chemotaxis protein
MVPLVLSIDDDKSSQILMHAYLKDEDFCAEFVSKVNGQEAIDYLVELANLASAEAWPDVIFLDINMPVLDGWGFIARFKELCELHSQYPIVVMVSATQTAEDLAKVEAEPLLLNLTLKPINSRTIDQLRQLSALRGFFNSRQPSSMGR